MAVSKELEELREIAKNLDYSLRINGCKNVVVMSDRPREGKSAFLAHCLPILCELYDKNVLVFDLQSERNDYLECQLIPIDLHQHEVQKTRVKGLDYVHASDCIPLNIVSDSEMSRIINIKFEELSAPYDVVFINTKFAAGSSLPLLPLDGAILVRSRKSLGKAKNEVSNELMDRDIPVLGIVMNEGV